MNNIVLGKEIKKAGL